MDKIETSSKKFLFISSIIFWLLFSIFFLYLKKNNIVLFDNTVESLAIYQYVISSASQTKDILVSYWAYFWWIFFILYILLAAIILLITKIFTLAKYQTTIAIIVLLINVIFFSLWIWFMYFEPQIIPIAVWITLFVWKPLLYSSLIMLIISIVYMIKTVFTKIPKVPNNILVVFMLFFLWWCMEWCSVTWSVMLTWCNNVEDSDHCFQKAAIANNNPELCDEIEYWPPRDKCHMMIAMTNGDEEYCEWAEWVSGWYSQEFCESKVEEVSSGSLDSSSGSLDVEEQKKKNEEFVKIKDKIFEDIDYNSDEKNNDDIKVEVAKQFNDYRKENQDKSVEEWTKKMEDIATDTQTMKRLDVNANKMLDDMKSSMVWYVNSKTDEAKDAVLDEWWSRVKMLDNTKELERRIKSLEWIKWAYDKASDSYNFINEKLEKIKKIKEEIEWIYTRMDQVDGMLKNDKIDAWQARVLKWAILLDEWLKNVTWYVPVFWSTISTISDETFNVVIKFASKRASRTHALNKCIDSPETCDANGISPY